MPACCPPTASAVPAATGPEALVIVDHGSRLDAANRMLEDVADMLRGMQARPVYAAHMELADPSIAQAFASAVRDGARFVYVFPYFLSPGRHSQRDIPALVAAAAREHPGVGYHVSGPIGLDRAMGELILSRLSACARRGYDPTDCPHCPPVPGPGPTTP